nr:MAG TPA_asm: hypothetical protein [Caudoviricetes sp.]
MGRSVEGVIVRVMTANGTPADGVLTGMWR